MQRRNERIHFCTKRQREKQQQRIRYRKLCLPHHSNNSYCEKSILSFSYSVLFSLLFSFPLFSHFLSLCNTFLGKGSIHIAKISLTKCLSSMNLSASHIRQPHKRRQHHNNHHRHQQQQQQQQGEHKRNHQMQQQHDSEHHEYGDQLQPTHQPTGEKKNQSTFRAHNFISWHMLQHHNSYNAHCTLSENNNNNNTKVRLAKWHECIQTLQCWCWWRCQHYISARKNVA